MNDSDFNNSITTRKQQRSKKQSRWRLLIRILLAAILIEAGWFWIAGISTKQVMTKWETIEEGCWVDALFLRDETVLTAKQSGNLDISAAAGVRLSCGEPIARIQSDGNSTDDDNLTQIAQNSEELKKLQTESDALQTRLQRIETVAQSVPASKLRVLKQEKAEVLRSIEENREQLTQLSEKIGLQQTASPSRIVAPIPGFLYYQYDQWEGKISVADFSKLNEGDFQRQYSLTAVKDKQHVESGTIVGKMIDPFNQVIAFIVDTKQTGVPKIGDPWWVQCPGSIQDTTVSGVKSLGNRRMIVGLDAPAVVTAFAPERRSRIYIIYRRTTGISVPVQALFKEGSKYTVRVVKFDGYRPQQVRLIASNGDKAIIEGIEFGTTIISR